MRVSYAIVFVSDMKRSVAFYRDVIGLPLKFDSPEWTEFATEGATLALHASDPKALPVADPESKRAAQCRPGFAVPDLAAFHARMVENKVRCVEQPKSVFGVQLAQYADPDGLPISVSEERKAKR